MLLSGLACLVLINGVLCWRCRKDLVALWREPVLRVSVVIIESDDWGPGPAEQGQALERLRAILCRHRDNHGRHPVMTLGLTLAACNRGGEVRYLDHPTQRELLAQIRAGIAEGVFSAQLHGMEHYCPEVLLDAARSDPALHDWVVEGDGYTESLPSALQSRWIDARQLPSGEHPPELIEQMVAAEVAEFARIFGTAPAVVVPPTFVWTPEVETAWARHGVRYLVSCGKRFVARDTAGRLIDDGSRWHNGDCSNGLLYLVRDAYFEPIKEHRAADAAATLARYAECARPLLLETHRNNFTRLNPQRDAAFEALDEGLGSMLRLFPATRFLTTEELARAIECSDADLLAQRPCQRLRAWAWRVRADAGLWRIARFSGGALLLRLLCLLPCRS